MLRLPQIKGCQPLDLFVWFSEGEQKLNAVSRVISDNNSESMRGLKFQFSFEFSTRTGFQCFTF